MHGLQGAAGESSDPAQRGTDLEYAVLVLLERLAPEERAAFLLREVFEVDYAVVAQALGREEAACRQMVHRARERVAEGRPRRAGNAPVKPPTAEEKMDLLRRFRAATETGDAATLAGLLAPNATYTADGGGKVFAARSVLQGAARIERLITTVARKAGDDVGHTLVLVDGEPALATFRGEEPSALTFIAADEDGVLAIYRIFNPDKLRRLPAAVAGGHPAG
jgi:RNA polymerase sigma-70 factor (ECF subfamily)